MKSKTPAESLPFSEFRDLSTFSEGQNPPNCAPISKHLADPDAISPISFIAYVNNDNVSDFRENEILASHKDYIHVKKGVVDTRGPVRSLRYLTTLSHRNAHTCESDSYPPPRRPTWPREKEAARICALYASDQLMSNKTGELRNVQHMLDRTVIPQDLTLKRAYFVHFPFMLQTSKQRGQLFAPTGPK